MNWNEIDSKSSLAFIVRVLVLWRFFFQSVPSSQWCSHGTKLSSLNTEINHEIIKRQNCVFFQWTYFHIFLCNNLQCNHYLPISFLQNYTLACRFLGRCILRRIWLLGKPQKKRKKQPKKLWKLFHSSFWKLFCKVTKDKKQLLKQVFHHHVTIYARDSWLSIQYPLNA